MVIEFLTFDIDPAEQEQWLVADEQHWSRLLEQQDGFIKKQIWRAVDDERAVHAVIYWQSLAQWHAISQAELDAVSKAMGEWDREPTCATFDLVRQS